MRARDLAFALMILAPRYAQAQTPVREDVEAREEWFWSRRSYPSNVRPYAQMEAARLAAARARAGGGGGGASLSIAPATSLLTGSWRPIGPYGLFEADPGYFNSAPQMDAGRVIGISPPRVAGGPLLIASASGGVWRATGLGAPWTPVTDNQCWGNMGAIVSDPVNPSIVYAGTGEYNAFTLGCGMLRSIDGGNTWTNFNTGLQLTNGASGIFGSILIDSATAGTTGSTILIGATAEGMVLSTNSGLSWTHPLTGSPSSLVSTKGGTVFTGMTDFGSSFRNGVWKSTTSGATWSQLPAFPGVDITTIRRVELAVSPAAPNKVFAIVGNGVTFGLNGLFVYNDTAGTWTQLSGGGITTNNTGRGDFGKQSEYDLAIAVDPRNANRIYVAGVRAYRSTDGGSTFTPMGMEIHCDWHTIVIDPLNPDILYAGTDGGFFVSKDAGDTWISYNNGLAITQYYPGVSLHPSGTVAMGGSQDNGTQAFNGTPFWDGVGGGDGGYTAINYANPSIQYGEAEWLGGPTVYRVQNGLVKSASNGIASTDRAQFIPPFVMDPVTPTKLYFGTQRLYRTTNEGTLWSAISGDLSKGSGTITAIAVAPSDTNTIYVGTSDGNVQVSRDGGTTFTVATAGLPNAVITDFAIDPSAATHAIVTYQGYGTSTGHVFETMNAGTLWTNISGNLITVGVNAVAFVGSNIFVGTDVGVYQSIDDGTTWSAGPTGLPNVVVHDLVYQASTGTLLAATYGRGMFTYMVSGTSAVLRGDVDGDGKLTAADALIVQQALVSSLSGSTAVYPKGDANCDGKIDASDVVLILRASVGLSNGTACVGTIK